PEEVLHAPRPGRAGGMLGVMGHIFVVGSIWKAHLTGGIHGYESRQMQVAVVLDVLRQRQAQLDQWYLEFLQQQQASALAKSIDFVFIGGEKGRMQMSQMLTHVANHATYHRGYVADMIYETGGVPPTMDIPVFVRHEQALCG
ncbi:DinB family protein, partial [Nostoc sp. CHAB 5715]|uniref:DinB family protein n=1 Tax=Nostoc sp. CHAB 5715 TaxID=2780400 RepID=UPI001E506097